jgi:hypothetical protein
MPADVLGKVVIESEPRRPREAPGGEARADLATQ